MSTHLNTHPNTPFGKFFYKCGIWHPTIEEGIKAAYDKLHDEEKIIIKDVSGVIAVINSNAQQAPAFIWDLIEQKFPALTKESVTGLINHINTEMKIIDGQIPDDFDAGITKLKEYLSGFEGKAWASITRAVVEIGSVFLSGGKLNIQTVFTVLEYVYQMFVKPRVNA